MTHKVVEEASAAANLVNSQVEPEVVRAAKADWYDKYANRMVAIAELATDEDWVTDQITESLDMDWQPSWAGKRVAETLINDSKPLEPTRYLGDPE